MEQNKDQKEAAPFDGFSFSDPFHSFLVTVRRVILQPVGFFSTISSKRNIMGAFVFALICIEVGFLLNMLLDRGMSLGVGFFAIGDLIFTAILIPILGIVLLFSGAVILHILVVILVNADKLSWDSGFWATFKIVSYAFVTALFGWVPILGPILILYSIYIIFAGVRQMHRRPQAGLPH